MLSTPCNCASGPDPAGGEPQDACRARRPQSSQQSASLHVEHLQRAGAWRWHEHQRLMRASKPQRSHHGVRHRRRERSSYAAVTAHVRARRGFTHSSGLASDDTLGQSGVRVLVPLRSRGVTRGVTTLVNRTIQYIARCHARAGPGESSGAATCDVQSILQVTLTTVVRTTH